VAKITVLVGLLLVVLSSSEMSVAQVSTPLSRHGKISASSVSEPIAAGEPIAKSLVPAEAKDAANTPVVVVIGDSLAEGYGVQRSQAFPDRAEELLRARGHAVRIVNGGISGSVTADADRRLRWYLRIKPRFLLLELGGNDGLKGTPISVIRANLKKVIDLAKENHLTVILAGMQIYASYGAAYTAEFANMYRELAREEKIELIPFLLKGVALMPGLNQPDMKHPNVMGHEIVAHTVADFLEPLL